MSETIILTLFASTNLQKLIGRDGGDPELPTIKPGDTLVVFLRTFDDSSGTNVETWPNIRQLNATIGKTLEPPSAGEFTLKKGTGGTPFGPFTLDSDEDEVATLFNAAALGFTCDLVERVDDDDSEVEGTKIAGLWNVRFDDNVAHDDLQVAVNSLRPESFVHVRPFQIGDVWWHELMLTQAPLAAKEDDHARVLAPSPTVTEIKEGGDPDGTSDVDVNEIQELLVPFIGYPNPFIGAFALRWGGRESSILTQEDGPDQIAAALNGMWKDGLKRFKCTLAGDNKCWIEFIGPLRDAAQALITVSVKAFRPGALMFTLPCDHSPMYAAMRRTKSLKSTLELEFEVIPDGADPEDLEVVGRMVTIAQQEVTVVREGIPAWLQTVPSINYLRPPEPKSYRRESTTTFLTGNQATVVAAIGDGVAYEYTVAHNKGTPNGCFSLRENTAGGRYLTPLEYTVTLGDDPDNEFILSFPEELDPPSLNQYVFNFTAAGPASVFAAGLTVTEDQVIDLDDDLDAIRARLTALEDAAPGVEFSTPADPSETTTVEIPLIRRTEILAGRFAAGFNPTTALADGTGLSRRPPALFPAVHVADGDRLSVTTDGEAGALPADPSAHAGELWINDTGSAITLLGGLGWRTETVPDGEYIASDGRRWYRVTHRGTTTSYHPTGAERLLFDEIIDPRLLPPGGQLDFTSKLKLATLRADTAAHWVVVIEVGTAAPDTTPATTGENLADVVWDATPLFKQRMLMTGTPVTRTIGCLIARDPDGSATFTASGRLDGRLYTADAVPAETTFALRARLIEFDTENSVSNARGYLFYDFSAATINVG